MPPIGSAQSSKEVGRYSVSNSWSFLKVAEITEAPHWLYHQSMNSLRAVPSQKIDFVSECIPKFHL
jgi:hypothetical protein